MTNIRNAVKSLILHKDKFLLVKRRKNDPSRPDTWDVPGSRLDLGENPLSGVKREVFEETKLSIDIVAPVGVHHFTRDDGQAITMIVFFCKAGSDAVVLDEENQEFKWVSLDTAKDLLHENFRPDFDIVKNYFL